MIVGIRNEAAQFQFWEYINQIFGTVPRQTCCLQIQKKYSEIMKEWLIFKKVTFWRALCIYYHSLPLTHDERQCCQFFFARFAGSSLAELFARREKFPDKHLKRSEKVVSQLHAWIKVQ